MFIVKRNCQTILQRVEPFYIPAFTVSLYSQRKIFYKAKLWWHLSKEYLSWCLGWERFLWESFRGRKKTANRGEWIGTPQIEFTRKPAQGDHVGSGSIARIQGCVLYWWHSSHMPGPLSVIQEIWATYCFCSSCPSLKFFLECPFWSQVPFLVWAPRSRPSVQQAFMNLCRLLHLHLWYQHWLIRPSSGSAFPGLLQVESKLLFAFWLLPPCYF